MEVHVNYLAVAVAAIASYVVATVWYALLFSGLWKRLTGITEMKPTLAHVVLVFLGALVMSFVLLHSIVFGNAYVGTGGIHGGLMGGFFSWLGFVAPVTMMGDLYEKRPWKLWLLDNGFWLISLMVMGVILSVWK
jgi:hypothetical protein